MLSLYSRFLYSFLLAISLEVMLLLLVLLELSAVVLSPDKRQTRVEG